MSEIRKLPYGWKYVTIGEICQINYGDSLTSSRRERGAYRVFGSNGVVGFHNECNTNGRTVIIGRKGSAGAVHYSDSSCFSIDTTYYIDEKSTDQNIEFLFYLLGSIKLPSLSKHSAVPGLSREDVYNLTVLIPGVAEQSSISCWIKHQMLLVEQAMSAIDMQLKMCRELTEVLLAQSLADASVREIHLEQVLTEVTRGIGEKWADFPLLGVSRSGISQPKQGLGKSPERYKPVEIGTIFYNPMRILLGSIGLLDGDGKPGIASPDYVVFRCNHGAVHYRWFYYWMRSSYGEAFIKSMARGAVRERMLFRRLVEGKVLLPSYEVQARVSEQLTMVAQIEKPLREQLEALSAMPEMILTRAFSGEVSHASEDSRFDSAEIGPHRPLPKDHIGAVLAYTISQLSTESTFGRTQNAKGMYFAEAHLGLNFGGVYEHYPAGPLDTSLYDLERYAESQEWFSVREIRHGNRKVYRYDVGANVSQAIQLAEQVLGEKKGEWDRVLSLFRGRRTKHAEIAATLFAVWNDFLLDGVTPTDVQIIESFRAWDEKKLRFKDETLQATLQWMREHQLIPRGQGKHTQPRVLISVGESE